MGTKKKQKYEYKMRGVRLESEQCIKDLGVTIVPNLKFPQHCKDATSKAIRMLGFINKYNLISIY